MIHRALPTALPVCSKLISGLACTRSAHLKTLTANRLHDLDDGFQGTGERHSTRFTCRPPLRPASIAIPYRGHRSAAGFRLAASISDAKRENTARSIAKAVARSPDTHRWRQTDRVRSHHDRGLLVGRRGTALGRQSCSASRCFAYSAATTCNVILETALDALACLWGASTWPVLPQR